MVPPFVFGQNAPSGLSDEIRNTLLSVEITESNSPTRSERILGEDPTPGLKSKTKLYKSQSYAARMGLRNQDADKYLPSTVSETEQSLSTAGKHYLYHAGRYLQDPAYQKKHPFKAMVFSEWLPDEFQTHPIPEKVWAPVGYLGYREFSRERIEGVDLLVIDPGSGLGSGKGHLALRIRFNRAEEHKVDISNDLVIAFSAYTDGSINMWAGLSGEYPSQIQFAPMGYFTERYLLYENRGIFIYPLRLNKQEMWRLLLKSVELYWGHQEQYYFLSRNCATELLELIQSSIDDPVKIYIPNVITPRGVTGLLLKPDLMRTKLHEQHKDDLQALQQHGCYLFPESYRIEKALAVLKQWDGERALDVETYLFLTPEERSGKIQELYQSNMELSQGDMLQLLANALYLEEIWFKLTAHSLLSSLRNMKVQEELEMEVGAGNIDRAREKLTPYMASVTGVSPRYWEPDVPEGFVPPYQDVEEYFLKTETRREGMDVMKTLVDFLLDDRPDTRKQIEGSHLFRTKLRQALHDKAKKRDSTLDLII